MGFGISVIRKTVRTLAVVVAVSVAFAAHAQGWPSERPVKIINPFTAGSASDILARMVADELQAVFKQSFVVENKAGASGMIGAEAVAKSPGDGYTLVIMTSSIAAQNPFFFKKISYDPVADFTPIGRIVTLPFALVVNGSAPFNSLADLVAFARNPANKASYGYVQGTGQAAAAAFGKLANLNAVAVGYKGWPQAWTDLAGGQFTFAIGDMASSRPLVQSGRLKMLAVTSEQKTALAPQLPTIASEAQLPGFDIVTWIGLSGPANMAPETVRKISTAMNAMLMRADVKAKMNTMGMETSPISPEEFRTYIKSQIEMWRVKAKEAGIEPE